MSAPGIAVLALAAAVLAALAGAVPGYGARAAGGPAGRTARLERAATATLRADTRLASEALETDRVPAAAARVLAGPALRALAAAAAARRRDHLRVRVLRSELRVVSLSLARGGAVELVARWRQELAPLAPDGTPLGRPLWLDERARILLRRLRGAHALRVWRVELLR